MKVLGAIFGYLPYVLAGVTAVETAIGPGNGTLKKQLVLNAITAAAQVGEQVPEQHVAAISALIDATVQSLNKSGIFKTGALPAAA